METQVYTGHFRQVIFSWARFCFPVNIQQYSKVFNCHSWDPLVERDQH